jgi:hypothetical protein
MSPDRLRDSRCAADRNQGKKLSAAALVVTKLPVQGRRDGSGSLRSHSPQRHAHVVCFEDHPNPFRLELLIQPTDHLHGEALLGLKVTGKPVDNPGQLRQADDAFCGQIADVRHAVKWQEMVLAQGAKRKSVGPAPVRRSVRHSETS